MISTFRGKIPPLLREIHPSITYTLSLLLTRETTCLKILNPYASLPAYAGFFDRGLEGFLEIDKTLSTNQRSASKYNTAILTATPFSTC